MPLSKFLRKIDALILQRTNEGRARAMADGVRFGRLGGQPPADQFASRAQWFNRMREISCLGIKRKHAVP
jgi:hypothetical protein